MIKVSSGQSLPSATREAASAVDSTARSSRPTWANELARNMSGNQVCSQEVVAAALQQSIVQDRIRTEAEYPDGVIKTIICLEMMTPEECDAAANDWLKEHRIRTEAALKGYDIAKYCPDGVLSKGPGSWCFREDEQ